MTQGAAVLPVQHHLPAAGERKRGIRIIIQHCRKRAKTFAVCKPVIAEHNLNVGSLRHFDRGIPVQNMSIRLLVPLVLYHRITPVHQCLCLIAGRVVRYIHLKVRVRLSVDGLQQALHFIRIVIAGNTDRNFWSLHANPPLFSPSKHPSSSAFD